MKLSRHSKQRMAERSSVKKQQIPFFKNALLYGIPINQLPDSRLKSNFTLKMKRYKSQIKLYKGYMFAYSKNSKQLYTMYAIPDEYQDELNELRIKYKKWKI